MKKVKLGGINMEQMPRVITKNLYVNSENETKSQLNNKWNMQNANCTGISFYKSLISPLLESHYLT